MAVRATGQTLGEWRNALLEAIPSPDKDTERRPSYLVGNFIDIDLLFQGPLDLSVIGAASSITVVFLTVDAVRWNMIKFQYRYEQWQNSYLCVRCSQTCIIDCID